MKFSKGLYLVGPPGAGKTTVMTDVLDQLGLVTCAWKHLLPGEPGAAGALRAEPVEDIVTGAEMGLHLGLTRLPFGGSDALGLNTHPTLLRWSDALDPADPELPPLLFGEGARFGTVPVFRSLSRWCDLAVVLIDCDPEEADRRREARNTEYPGSGRHGRPTAASPSYVKTQRTKAQRAYEGARELGLNVTRYDTTDADPGELATELIGWWGWVGE